MSLTIPEFMENTKIFVWNCVKFALSADPGGNSFLYSTCVVLKTVYNILERGKL